MNKFLFAYADTLCSIGVSLVGIRRTQKNRNHYKESPPFPPLPPKPPSRTDSHLIFSEYLFNTLLKKIVAKTGAEA